MTRPRFVVHDHRRPRPHTDLRLERDGTLKCWALPRGRPPSAQQNRLAIAVPDHDLAQLDYEDETKTIADAGWWEDLRSDERRWLFVLHGREAAVRYALIRTGTAWLLHRTVAQP